ncbi:MAG: 1-deoxy-D-xylulose-5-phosphate synthase [Oscillospiraceae bacterium]|nr:1-deoxy-D-xylulose-5-phosphate synthase [Oscillospiraceae bacterium]
MGLLEKISSPEDLKKLNIKQTEALCVEIRDLLLKTISRTGGHLASNLGTVELTVALHRVFSTPVDQIVWDVGHQAYTHKILTGRQGQMSTLRSQGGISGFPKPGESEHDAFIAGHSSTSISVANGLARAKTLKGEPGHVIAVIGDGAFTGGMAYEALNNAGRYPDKIIVVLNDNDMSISQNVGTLAQYLAKIRSRPEYFAAKDQVNRTLKKMPGVGEPMAKLLDASRGMVKSALYHSTLFEDFGFQYLGPVDGHNMENLCAVFARAKAIGRPVVVHVKTVKGKGYVFAEKNPDAYHGVSSFQLDSGNPDVSGRDSFSAHFGKALMGFAEKDQNICAVTAAMKYGTGLQGFSQKYPERFYDVGIAEEHGVTFCAGLAAGGELPVFAVYSSFLQRGYDQLLHDGAIGGYHFVLGIDRAGLVGEDGETHQGVFDAAFLATIPGVTLFAPATYREMEEQLEHALYRCPGIAAVRYPRGDECRGLPTPFEDGDDMELYGEGDILLVTYGRTIRQALAAAQKLEETGVSVQVCRLKQVLPFPQKALETALGKREVWFAEEGIKTGGIGQLMGSGLLENGFEGRFFLRAVEGFVPQSTEAEAMMAVGLDEGSLAKWIGDKNGEGRPKAAEMARSRV